jgi:hypothetical protein
MDIEEANERNLSDKSNEKTNLDGGSTRQRPREKQMRVVFLVRLHG